MENNDDGVMSDGVYSDSHDDYLDDGFADLNFQSQANRDRKNDFDIDYSIYSTAQLDAQRKKEVAHVADMCGLANHQALALLFHFRWNKERLLERFMEDSEATLEQAKIMRANASNSSVAFHAAPSDFSCAICCRDAIEENAMRVATFSCGHLFCTLCVSQYLLQKIQEKGEVRRIDCPGANCSTLFDDESIKKLCDTSVVNRYQRLLTKAYVNDSEYLRWCPAPNCDYACECHIRSTQLSRIIPTVVCRCEARFCFGCGLADHQPCICSLVKLWIKKCTDESETANWIAANTKECTNCQATIEKNGGCNHMTCKSCKEEFCWVCMGPWKDHNNNFYDCNRFDEKSSKDARNAQVSSRRQLERYLHYFNRYANHEESARLAHTFYSRAEKKMEEMQLTSGFSWIEVQFMKKALEVVLECRQILKWTYAFAFYLERNNQTELFEVNQRDLEVALEALNGLIEQPLPDSGDSQKELLSEMKQQILDKTEYCSQRKVVMLIDTCKGLQEGRWTFL